MNEDWPEMARELSHAIKEVRLGTPEVMQSFSAMAKAATEGGALDVKTKELMASPSPLPFAVTAVRPFTRRLHSSMALHMGAGPSLIYAAQAVEAYDQFAKGSVAA
ncbi:MULTISPECIES: carboxymuconolactone decarboxylase family protein [unclassified Sphingobium]|uniref:carboxymuconolactone decarboxylase family protein n=1 Tax=unclassified Sphingobium TaxID=2611147 RepID=UPI00222515F7|nr:MULTISPECIES: carboxymuconolactone decarboxylase family protein [unclassified Sphingobium]MCW2412598.1 hypothetical protein [Sphingobium sp. B8D3D]MCW2415105.1 hypothetical protein [Sphingobium sp. B8D3A]